MLILSAAEMQACDRETTERFGLPSLDLMRAASRAVTAIAGLEFPQAHRITFLCGRGNNGGDGMMAATLMAEAGREVSVVLLGAPEGIKGDAAHAWEDLIAAGECRVVIVTDASELNQFGDLLDCDLLVDALVGTGFKPPLSGLPLAVLDWVKAAIVCRPFPILAVDLPSGWPADSTEGAVALPVFPADAVVTFTAPKPAHVFGQLTRRWDQPVVVAPIGSPDEAIVSDLKLHWAGSAQSLTGQPRPVDANKGKFGHVLVVGGTFGSAGGKAGAPAMSSLAAMRVGAGLVTAAVPAPALAVVSGCAPELMTLPLPANAAGEISPDALEPGRLAAMTKGITVLAIGPGLGQSEDAARFCVGLLEATTMPVVIDADALNIVARDPAVMAGLARQGRTVVMTPHPGEMSRLAGIPTAEVQARRLEVARSFAQTHGVILVLKGARTLIAHPDGRVAVSTTGNPGMAKGGSGDLLTGMVAGMLAQYAGQPARAVEAAVFLDGLAGDLAVRTADEHTLLATDRLPHLSAAYRFRSRTANGYVWLQGMPRESEADSGSREALE